MRIWRDLNIFARSWGISSDRSVQALGVLLGLSGPADGNLIGAEFTDQIVSVFTTQLKSLSRRQPMLIIFEDIHWIDPSTADLLTKIISFIRAEALPVLVISLTYIVRSCMMMPTHPRC